MLNETIKTFKLLHGFKATRHELNGLIETKIYRNNRIVAIIFDGKIIRLFKEHSPAKFLVYVYDV